MWSSLMMYLVWEAGSMYKQSIFVHMLKNNGVRNHLQKTYERLWEMFHL